MRYTTAVFLLTAFTVSLFLFGGCGGAKAITTETAVKKYYNRSAGTLLNELQLLDSLISTRQPVDRLRQQFIKCRLQYKKTEGIVEYYFQGLTKRINGPALPDVKTDDNQVWPPHGLQVIEQFLYNGSDTVMVKEAANEIKILQADIRFTISNFKETTVLPLHLNELVQHQLIRIATQSVTGFDAPLSKESLAECAAALTGLQEILALLPVRHSAYEKELRKSLVYLQTHTDFDGFDRLSFIKKYLMPLSDSAASCLRPLLPADTLLNRPFTGGLSALLRGKNFNPDFFTAYADAAGNTYKKALGEKLFYETRLSKKNNISCGTCHQPAMYFTDGLAKAVNFVHGGSLQRNTPSLFYTAFQNSQFYDMRSPYLEDQVNEVMKNSDEFNFSATGIALLLSKDTAYGHSFKNAFPKTSVITSFEVRNAIACYIRSLQPFSSAFDRYMNGEEAALGPAEKEGFNLFAGKAKCATCHFIPLFNGTVPPWYNKSESEIIGVPAKPVWQKAVIDADPGRYAYNQLEPLRFAFKTPTLRNIEKTAPYMHNGVYKTLAEAVEFYHKGGGVGLGINLPYQSLPFDSLQLNTAEKKALISFMQSLTDEPVQTL
jgi:cytochrome c peroxidase